MSAPRRAFICICAALLVAPALAQDSAAPPGVPVPVLPAGPLHYETGEGFDISVDVLARGLSLPWGFAQLPDGTLLVTERNKGTLRVIRDGVLDLAPVAGVPATRATFFGALLDVVLHPRFADNRLLYLSYNKPLGNDTSALAVLRARWDGAALQDAEDIFVATPGVVGSPRLLFDRAGLLYVSMYGGTEDAQDPALLGGKVLRLRDDGSVPGDNPFLQAAGTRPEIFTLGHRTPQGMVLHPQTGEIWSAEMGPNGGDEINVLRPGGNYGWPLVSLGRDYPGPWAGEAFSRPGFENPVAYWMPSITVSGLAFYTGERLPQWQGDLFVAGLRYGEIPGTGQLQRIRFNAQGEEIRREVLLADLRQRLRGPWQGADGYLYVLVDAEQDAAILRIGPAD